MTEIIPTRKNENFLNIDNYLYTKKFDGKNGKVHWCCRKRNECSALARTKSFGGRIEVLQGPNESKHTNHTPNADEVTVEKRLATLKRNAEEHPEALAIPIMCLIDNEPDSVPSRMPDRDNIGRAIQRTKENNLPKNPTSLDVITDIPDQYKLAKCGRKFLFYDSLDDDVDKEVGRILLFITKDNLTKLILSHHWYLDGTLNVVFYFPSFQIVSHPILNFTSSPLAGCTDSLLSTVYNFGLVLSTYSRSGTKYCLACSFCPHVEEKTSGM